MAPSPRVAPAFFNTASSSSRAQTSPDMSRGMVCCQSFATPSKISWRRGARAASSLVYGGAPAGGFFHLSVLPELASSRPRREPGWPSLRRRGLPPERRRAARTPPGSPSCHSFTGERSNIVSICHNHTDGQLSDSYGGLKAEIESLHVDMLGGVAWRRHPYRGCPALPARCLHQERGARRAAGRGAGDPALARRARCYINEIMRARPR